MTSSSKNAPPVDFNPSASLTPFEQNTQVQGPGGQAYELAPTSRRSTHADTPMPRLAPIETWLIDRIGDIGRSVAKVGAKLAAPVLDANPATRQKIKRTAATFGLLVVTGMAAKLVIKRLRA